MNGATAASAVAIAMALVLAWRSLSGRKMSGAHLGKMAAIWVAIVIVVVATIQWLGLEVAQ